jgi:hypothetical protein
MLQLRALRWACVLGLLLMVGMISWASWSCPLFGIPGEVLRHPWFLTTLFDAYLAFLPPYVWMAWRETRVLVRVLWFPVVMLWGNVAILIYLWRELHRLPSGATVVQLLTERRAGGWKSPLTLLALAVGVYAWGARGLLEGSG